MLTMEEVYLMPRKKITPPEANIPGGDVADLPARGARARKPVSQSQSPAAENKEKKAASPASTGFHAAAPATERGSSRIHGTEVTVQEQIALLAYSYWQARGCRGGSPEDDWYRAEQEIRSRLAIASEH